MDIGDHLDQVGTEMNWVFAMIGFLSAYALGPTVGTLNIRQEWGQLPDDLSKYEVFLAVENCDHIGKEATLHVGDESYTGIVFDCAGANAYEDGQSWMSLLGIVAEVDYWFWLEHPELIGTETHAKVTISP